MTKLMKRNKSQTKKMLYHPSLMKQKNIVIKIKEILLKRRKRKIKHLVYF